LITQICNLTIYILYSGKRVSATATFHIQPSTSLNAFDFICKASSLSRCACLAEEEKMCYFFLIVLCLFFFSVFTSRGLNAAVISVSQATGVSETGSRQPLSICSEAAVTTPDAISKTVSASEQLNAQLVEGNAVERTTLQASISLSLEYDKFWWTRNGDKFIQVVASALGVPHESVVISNVRAGSVIVDVM
jgi:hypothetical protein